MRRKGWLIGLIAGVVVGCSGVKAGDGWLILSAVGITPMLGFLLELAAYAVSDEYRLQRRLEQIRREKEKSRPDL